MEMDQGEEIMSDWAQRPSIPMANERQKVIRRRVGFEQGQPVIETFDYIPHEEAKRHLEALKEEQRGLVRPGFGGLSLWRLRI